MRDLSYLKFLPALLALVALPLALNLIGPNDFYGFRFGASLASEEAWYRINQVGGVTMLVSSLVTFVLVLLKYDSAKERGRELPLCLIAIFVPVILSIVAAVWAI